MRPNPLQDGRSAIVSLDALRREYGDRPLGPSDLDPDPIRQFEAWFADAQTADIIEPNAMTVATVDDHGQPDARIVLLKEIRGDGFVFYTNYDSAKGLQLEANGRTALVFFWDRLERQVRVTGTAEPIPAAESDAYFDSRPIKSRIAAAASGQSVPVASRRELEERFERIAADFKTSGTIARPPRWGGFLVRPRTVEFWQGRRSRLHDRLRYSRTDDGWSVARLTP